MFLVGSEPRSCTSAEAAMKWSAEKSRSKFGLSKVSFQFALLSVALAGGPAGEAHGALATTGQWTPSANWCVSGNCNVGANQRYAVHLALLPGDGSPHSRVIFWNKSFSSVFRGAEWGWSPGGDGCGAYPTSQLSEIGVPGVNMDLFCAGNTLLPDGRLFVAGGTDPVTGVYGENRARIFTTGAGSDSGSWSDPGDMVDWRWYPTTTSLRDGRVLVTSGVRHPYHRVFGGKRDGSAPSEPSSDSLFRFAPVDGGAWEAAQTPGRAFGGWPA